MPTQEPTITISVRLPVATAVALDERCVELGARTGNPHSKADVVRMALAVYLGIAEGDVHVEDPHETAPAGS